jgi:hypothetical protein
MYQSQLYPRITRIFRPAVTATSASFVSMVKANFVEDGTFNNLDMAMSFTSLVVRFVDQVAEGQVFDKKQKQLVFTCQSHVPNLSELVLRVRETPAPYAQLAMQGFDQQEVRTKLPANTARRCRRPSPGCASCTKNSIASCTTNPTERPPSTLPQMSPISWMCFIGNLDHEELWVVDLDTRNRVMQLVALYKGSVNSSQVTSGGNLSSGDPGQLTGHHHRTQPSESGDCSPFPDDVAVTRAIFQAGKLLDIDVLDHLVISKHRFVSLKERGMGFE